MRCLEIKPLFPVATALFLPEFIVRPYASSSCWTFGCAFSSWVTQGVSIILFFHSLSLSIFSRDHNFVLSINNPFFQGGLYLSSSTATIINCVISGNTAARLNRNLCVLIVPTGLKCYLVVFIKLLCLNVFKSTGNIKSLWHRTTFYPCSNLTCGPILTLGISI